MTSRIPQLGLSHSFHMLLLLDWWLELLIIHSRSLPLKLQLTLHHAQIVWPPDPQAPLSASCQPTGQLTPPSPQWELSVVSDTQSGSFCVPSCLRNACLDQAQRVFVSHTHTFVSHTHTHTQLIVTSHSRPHSLLLSLNIKLIISKPWRDAPFSGCDQLTVSLAAHKYLCSYVFNQKVMKRRRAPSELGPEA